MPREAQLGATWFARVNLLFPVQALDLVACVSAEHEALANSMAELCVHEHQASLPGLYNRSHEELYHHGVASVDEARRMLCGSFAGVRPRGVVAVCSERASTDGRL